MEGTRPAPEPAFEAKVSTRPGAEWPRLVGRSDGVRQLEQAIERVGAFDCPVLVTGETGCGKEEVARAIHAAGSRAGKPFVAMNCGGIVASLAESLLFGHARGAFTGADAATSGAFRAADGGILFLDEIGELPLDLQPKLLRALQQREVTPVGCTRPVPVDVQVIAATNRDLDAEVAAGRFREDLYYRLNTIHLTVPPLRARREDIPAFVAHFSAHFAVRFGLAPWRPDAATLERFVRHSWPGNVRELAHTIQRIYILGDEYESVLEATFSGGTARVPPPPPAPSVAIPPAAPAAAPTGGDPVLPLLDLDELRRIAVRQAMAATAGHRGKAARLLGVCPNTMTKLVSQACPDAPATQGRRRDTVRGRPR